MLPRFLILAQYRMTKRRTEAVDRWLSSLETWDSVPLLVHTVKEQASSAAPCCDCISTWIGFI